MPELTIQQAMEQAVQHHQAGRLPQAETIYRRVLAIQPNHADALHLLGALALRVGQAQVALELIGRASAIEPRSQHFLNSLGNAFHALGQVDRAAAAFAQAVQIDPQFAEGYSNLGSELLELGQIEPAIAACQNAIQLKPELADAHNNLGNALRTVGRIDEAIASFERAMRVQPDFAPAHANLSAALRDQGKLAEAEAAARRAIQLNPDFNMGHIHLGNALRDLARIPEAIAAYRDAIQCNPNFAEGYANLGVALLEGGNPVDAADACRKAIQLKPNLASAYTNLGNALKEQGELDQAIEAYRTAATLNPNDPVAQSNLIYLLHFHDRADDSAIREEQQRWNQRHVQPRAGLIQPHTNDRDPNRPLRIGYVGADFRDHCQSFFTIPLLSNHNRSQFQVYCYANVANPDDITRRIQGYAREWRNIAALRHSDVAQMIRDDRIDILIDLTLHMAGNRLIVFAHKPAPVQATWLGYPAGTGLETMDYRISDPHLDPEENDSVAERVIRLPDSFWCYDPLTDQPNVNAPPALSRGRLTFGCLNNFCKVNDRALEFWAKVLLAVPESRLMILANPGSYQDRTRMTLRNLGVDSSRLEFVPKRPRADYLKLYHELDLVLDTFPYNGHTTSMDSFWMGVPVISLMRKTPVSRAGLSLAKNLGLAQLVTDSPEQFVKIAADLATDLPRLAQLRSSLRTTMQRSPLMDAPRFARNMESAYRQMWRTWTG